MYLKRDYFSFISISTVSGRKNNRATDKVTSLLIFRCIAGFQCHAIQNRSK